MIERLLNARPYHASGLVLVGMLPAFGTPAAVLLFVLTLPAVSIARIKAHWLFLLCLIQYFLIHLGLNLWHDGSFSTARLNDSYIIMAFAAVSSTCFLGLACHRANFTRLWLAVGLLISVAALIITQNMGFNTMGGRAYGLMFNPLLPPAVFLPLTVLLFARWEQAPPWQKYLAYGVLLAVIVTVGAVNGARIAFYSGLITALVLTLWVLWQDTSRIFAMGALAIVGLSVFGIKAYDGLSGGRQADRFTEASSDISILIERALVGDVRLRGSVAEVQKTGISYSASARLALWNGALQGFGGRPWFGYGQSQEKSVINTVAQTRQPHAHNQYLSWLIWGGLPALISGLIFLAAPLLHTRTPASVLLCLLPLLMIFVTESLFYWPKALHAFTFMIVAIYAVHRVPCAKMNSPLTPRTPC